MAIEPTKRGQDHYLTADEIDILEWGKKNKDKINIELSRFKQDCRKRALDNAHSEWGTWNVNRNGSEPDIIKLADKYYQWLITIPDGAPN